jgi:hypothetical protein
MIEYRVEPGTDHYGWTRYRVRALHDGATVYLSEHISDLVSAERYAQLAANQYLAERGLPPDSPEVKMPGSWDEEAEGERVLLRYMLDGLAPTTNDQADPLTQLTERQLEKAPSWLKARAQEARHKSAAEVWNETKPHTSEPDWRGAFMKGDEPSNARKAFFGYAPASIQDDHEVA